MADYYLLESFFVESPVGLGLFDSDFRFVRLNKTLADLLEISVERALNRKIQEVLPKPLADIFENQLRTAISSGTPLLNTTLSSVSLGCPDLNRHCKASIFPVSTGELTPPGVGIQIVETTELRLTREELARKESFHRTVLDNIPARIFMKDPAGNYLYCNRHLASDAGLTQNEIIGKNDYDLYRVDLAEKYRSGDLKVIKSGRDREFEYRFEKNGVEHYIHVIQSPVTDAAGKIQGTVGLIQDLTQNKRAEQQLYISDQVLASTLNGVVISNLEGQITYVNPSFVKMWGYNDTREILGRPVAEFCFNLSDGREAFNVLHTKGNWEGEVNGLKKDGSTFDALLAGNIVKDEKGLPLVLLYSFIDITALKASEQRLLGSQKKYRQIIDHLDDAVWIYDTVNNKMMYANPAYETIYGRPRELLYRNSEDWLKAVHPEDRLRVIVNFYETGTAQKEHFRIIRSDSDLRHIYARTFPVVDEKGRVYREVGIAQDVTEARLAEIKIRNLSRRLLKVAEQERKNIARDLHDEFGQVLANLRRCHKHLLDHASEPPAIITKAKELNDLIKRIGEIVSSTTHNLRPDILDELGLVPTLTGTVKDFEKHWPNTNVTFTVKGRPSPIDPDHALVLYRILQEGLTNITKHAKAENVSVQLVFSSPSVIMCIKDDGHGFAEEPCGDDKKHLQGLGLRGIFERISAINGEAWICSHPGRGTTLRVEVICTPREEEINEAS